MLVFQVHTSVFLLPQVLTSVMTVLKYPRLQRLDEGPAQGKSLIAKTAADPKHGRNSKHKGGRILETELLWSAVPKDLLETTCNREYGLGGRQHRPAMQGAELIP